eukprot:927458_1
MEIVAETVYKKDDSIEPSVHRFILNDILPHAQTHSFSGFRAQLFSKSVTDVFATHCEYLTHLFHAFNQRNGAVHSHPTSWLTFEECTYMMCALRLFDRAQVQTRLAPIWRAVRAGRGRAGIGQENHSLMKQSQSAQLLDIKKASMNDPLILRQCVSVDQLASPLNEKSHFRSKLE